MNQSNDSTNEIPEQDANEFDYTTNPQEANRESNDQVIVDTPEEMSPLPESEIITPVE